MGVPVATLRDVSKMLKRGTAGFWNLSRHRRATLRIRHLAFAHFCRRQRGASLSWVAASSSALAPNPFREHDVRIDRRALPPALVGPQLEDREMKMRRVRRRVTSRPDIPEHL